jgi:plasmid replication initiation protein
MSNNEANFSGLVDLSDAKLPPPTEASHVDTVRPGRDFRVSKSNDLIAKTYKMNLSEQRLLAILVSQIHPADHDFSFYYFSIQTIAEVCGLDARSGSMRARVREALTGLMSRTVSLPVGEKGERLVNWLSSATLDYSDEGDVGMSFNPYLKPFLLALRDRFTTFGLHEVLHLRSKYSFRLFEVFKSIERLPRRRFSVEELRMLCGVADHEYKQVRSFRWRVLDPAIAELNAQTGLKITYERVIHRRKLIAWDFKVTKKKSKSAQARAQKLRDALRPVKPPPTMTVAEQRRLDELMEKEAAGALGPYDGCELAELTIKHDRASDFAAGNPNQRELFDQ